MEEVKIDNATKRPWYIRYFREQDPLQGFFIEAKKEGAAYNIEILSEDTGGDHYPVEQRLADAELIIRAVNSFDELQKEIGELKIQNSLLESDKVVSNMQNTFYRNELIEAISEVEDYKPSPDSGSTWVDGYTTAKEEILERLQAALKKAKP